MQNFQPLEYMEPTFLVTLTYINDFDVSLTYINDFDVC